MAEDRAGKKHIDPRDVASSTAAGVASRMGVARSKQAKGEQMVGTAAAKGAAKGAAGASKGRDSSAVMTVVLVVGLLVAMLAVMLWASGR